MMKDDDFKLWKGFALRRTDKRTNGQTFAIVESLSRLKKPLLFISKILQCLSVYEHLNFERKLEL